MTERRLSRPHPAEAGYVFSAGPRNSLCPRRGEGEGLSVPIVLHDNSETVTLTPAPHPMGEGGMPPRAKRIRSGVLSVVPPGQKISAPGTMAVPGFYFLLLPRRIGTTVAEPELCI